MIHKKTIFFDLDGTIINSANEIIKSLKEAFNYYKLIPLKEITSNLIGSPIDQIVTSLLKAEDQKKLNLVLDRFKFIYDNQFCFESSCYDGVHTTFNYLQRKSLLILVTNKRLEPSLKILEHHKLKHYFYKCFSVDYTNNILPNKALLLENILLELNINPRNSLYLGDTYDDFTASNENNINFIFAKWGYGTLPNHALCKAINKFEEMKQFI